MLQHVFGPPYPATRTVTFSNEHSDGLKTAAADPSLQANVWTDKPAYRIGETATVLMAVSEPASAHLTISSPSGVAQVYDFGIQTVASKSLIPTVIGRWTVTFEANAGTDFASALTYFDVAQEVYDVVISLSGLPTNLEVNLHVDGQYAGTLSSSVSRTLSFKVDTTHTIAVQQFVQTPDGAMYLAPQNMWSVSSTGAHTFSYVPQAPLTATAATTTSTPLITITQTSTSTATSFVSTTVTVTSLLTSNPLTRTTVSIITQATTATTFTEATSTVQPARLVINHGWILIRVVGVGGVLAIIAVLVVAARYRRSKAATTVDKIVLKYLEDHQGEISISLASQQLGISEKELTESLSRLSSKGVIRKE